MLFLRKDTRILLLIALLITGCRESSVTLLVYGHYGSDLHLHPSLLCNETFFDVYSGETLIGNYHESIQGFKGYDGRLEFSPRVNCIFTIKNFSQADGHRFSFTTSLGITMDFQVNVTDPSTDLSPEQLPGNVMGLQNTSTTAMYPNDTSGECTSGIIAFGFSLDPVICLVFIFLAMKMKETDWNAAEIVSLMQKTAVSFLGKRDRKWIDLACVLIKILSLVFQAVSLISLAQCGNIHGSGFFIAAASFTGVKVLLTAGWIYCTYKCDGWNMNHRKKYLFLTIVECFYSLEFPLCIAALYFHLYRTSFALLFGVLISFFLVSVILKILIFFLCRWKKKATNSRDAEDHEMT